MLPLVRLASPADLPGRYAHLGFEPVDDVGPDLRTLRAREERLGLARVGRRIVMRRGVGAEAVLVDLVTELADVLGEDLLGMHPAQVRSAALAHVRDWPRWVEDMRPIGAQAYAVLSICRAWCLLAEGRQRSKLSAAHRVEQALASDADLVAWARDWWYGGGADGEPSRFSEVREFVTRTSQRILERGLGDGRLVGSEGGVRRSRP